MKRNTTRMTDQYQIPAYGTRTTALEASLDHLAYMCLCAFIFTIPWGDASLGPGGIPYSGWGFAAAAGSALLKAAAIRQIRRPSAIHYWMVAFVGWAALTFLWSMDRQTTVVRVGSYLPLLLMVWVIWESATGERRREMLLACYVLGTYISAGATFLNYLAGRTASQMYAASGRIASEEERYSALGFNEDELGLLLALSIPMALYLLGRSRGKPVQWVWWFHLVLAPTAMLLTGTRGSLLSLAVVAVMVPATYARLSRLQKGLFAVALLGLAACVAWLLPAYTSERLMSIGSELSQGTLTNRTLIWKAGLDVFREHPLIGVGSGAYGASVFSRLDVAYAAHNTFLSVLVEEGVVGAMIFLGMLGSLLCAVLTVPKVERRLWTVLLVAWMIGVASITWEYRKVTWFLFAMAVAQVGLGPAYQAAVPRTAGIRPRLAVAREKIDVGA